MSTTARLFDLHATRPLHSLALVGAILAGAGCPAPRPTDEGRGDLGSSQTATDDDRAGADAGGDALSADGGAQPDALPPEPRPDDRDAGVPTDSDEPARDDQQDDPTPSPDDEPPAADPTGCNTTLTDGRRIAGTGAPLVRIDPGCGALSYARYPNLGQNNADHTVPDFSYEGYKGGGVPIPEVPVVVSLQPQAGDNRARIQAALDEVGARAPDASGFRGAVLLAAGRYEVGDTLYIDESGVVLRGVGQGPQGTVLVATRAVQHDFIVIRGSGNGLREVDGTRTAIESPLVPVGSRSFVVASSAGFAVGDTIAVVRTPNQTWIDDLAMAEFGWEPASFVVAHERTIEAIDGNAFTVDVPFVDTIEDRTGGGHVFLADTTQRVRHSGVEQLRLDSLFSSETDENHGWKAVLMDDAESCWVRGVTAIHFGYSAVSIEGRSRFNTVEEVAQLDPISVIDGGRRYSFNVSGGSGHLFQRCYARNGRHNFVTGSRVPGPNVWLDCLSERNNADEGPHHRWATGMLLDNVKSQEVNVQNREDAGTGHGWAGAQTMFWNIEATEAVRADAPRGAMNWAIGVVGPRMEGTRAPEEPFGWWESREMPVSPRSLYLAQLRDRLGESAVEATTVPAQRSGRIWAQLSAWAGNGAFSSYAPDPATGCTGILNSSGEACCPVACGACGGAGCGSRPGGADSCCTTAIREAGETCDEVGAPCLVP